MRFLLIFGILFSASAYADHASVNCAITQVTNVYTASVYQVPFGGANPAFTGLPAHTHMKVSNPSSVRICFNVGQSASIIPSNGAPAEHCVPATVNDVTWDFLPISNYLFIRSDGANCSSTTLDFDIW